MGIQCPTHYRKKPVQIVAWQLTRGHETAVANWCGGHTMNEPAADAAGCADVEITTLEGVMTARPGDYVIKGVQGEFYPCKPDIFEQTYEAS